MIPVSPVIPTANAKEVVVAEKQPEYQNLPSIPLTDGIILCRWKMTDEEKKIVAETGDIYLYQRTDGKFVTPMLLQVEMPEIPGAELYEDTILASEIIEPERFRAAREVNKPQYRIRCSFDAAPFSWGMEDGVFKDDLIVERCAANVAEDLRSEKYPEYLKADEHHFNGGGIAHSGFEPYVETHKGKVRLDESIWIVSNPNGDKEVYTAENFHGIYCLENSSDD